MAVVTVKWPLQRMVKNNLKIVDVGARLFQRGNRSTDIYKFTIPIDYGRLAVTTGKTDVYNIEL